MQPAIHVMQQQASAIVTGRRTNAERNKLKVEKLPDGSLISQDVGPLRIAIAKFIHYPLFENLLGTIIFAHLFCTVLETDKRAKGEDRPEWLVFSEIFFISFYSIEIILRLFIWRQAFFSGWSNCFEFGLVACDIVFQVADSLPLPNIAFLRVFRLIRLARSMRILMHFRELYIMAHGMVAAARALFWASVMLFIWLTVWSIVSVEVIHPLNKELAAERKYGNCDRCSRAFSTVAQSTLTYVQQIIAGDSWGRLTVPIIEKDPRSGLVFFSVLITVNFGLLNLILAVIVDRAQAAREQDVAMKMREKEEGWRKAKKELTRICEDMDDDKSEHLTLSELESGYDDNDDFRNAMNMMDIGKEDLATLFKIFDQDQSGEVTYLEFIEQLHKIRNEDSHIMLVMIRYYVNDLRQSMVDFMSEVKEVQAASVAARQAHESIPIKEDKLSEIERPPLPPCLSREAPGLNSDASRSVLAAFDQEFAKLATHLDEQLVIFSKDLAMKLDTSARSFNQRLDALLDTSSGDVGAKRTKAQPRTPPQATTNCPSCAVEKSPSTHILVHDDQAMPETNGRYVPSTCRGVLGLAT